jgi:hypothetical protein
MIVSRRVIMDNLGSQKEKPFAGRSNRPAGAITRITLRPGKSSSVKAIWPRSIHRSERVRSYPIRQSCARDARSQFHLRRDGPDRRGVAAQRGCDRRDRRAKNGVSLTRSRNCFSGIGTKLKRALCHGDASQEQQSFDVVDEVCQSDFHFCPGDADGANEQAHPVLLFGENMLNLGADFRRIAPGMARPFGFLRWTWLTKPFFPMNSSLAADR